MEELRRRIKELENGRNGGGKLNSEVEEEIEEEKNNGEVNPAMHLISFLSNRGITRV